MTQANHQLVRTYFDAMSKGHLADSLFTDDVTIWAVGYGNFVKANYQNGVRVLQTLFPNGLTFRIKTLIVEADQASAEVQASGTLKNGQVYDNVYVFLFRIRDGRIAAITEYYDQGPAKEKITPLFAAAMAAGA